MLFFTLCWVLFVTVSGQNEGESCTHTYANTVGKCTRVEQCETAKTDYERSGIKPEFCSYRNLGATLVCCRDETSTLQAAVPNRNHDRPIWGNGNRQENQKRVSERKCEEYNREVLQKVDYIKLIVGGTVTKADGGDTVEFPHMAAIGWLGFNNEYIFSCGGSLISPWFVLSAGHCVRNPIAKNSAPVLVRLGVKNIDNSVIDGANPLDLPIREIHTHPNYKPPVKYNDIALFKLAIDVTFTTSIRAACLWTKPDFQGYQKVVATGWGITDPNGREQSKELQKVTLTILENNYCNSLLSSLVGRNWNGFSSSQMCAGELKGGMDTCQGDSGSPLQIASEENHRIFHLVGITSFGKDCAKSRLPGVYTRVSSFLDWIESVVWHGE